jgi:hypothetical protein
MKTGITNASKVLVRNYKIRGLSSELGVDGMAILIWNKGATI